MSLRWIRIAAFLLVLPSAAAPAQIPRTLSYQGILSDTAGAPKPNAYYGMTFRLYSVAQGGSPLWSETQVLGTTRGLFNAVLGDITPFPDSLRFDRRYWLGIQVSPDPELTPRIQMTAAGYSINSRTADTAKYARSAPETSIADSARIAGIVPDNSLTSGKIGSGQILKSLNNLHDAVTLRAQGGATITSNGDTITINSGAGGGGTGIQGIQNTDNTLVISNPTGPTATVNTRIPLSLNGNWNTEQGALQILGDKPTIRFSGGAISGNESWIMHLGSDGPGNLSFFRRSGAATWTNVMSLATNGNVGIGTAGPRAPLEINGKLLITHDDALEVVGYKPFLTLTDANSGYLQSTIQGANGDFLFFPSGGAAMVIKSGTGNVGVGTNTPLAKLDAVSSTGVGVSGSSSASDGVTGNSSVAGRSGVWGSNPAFGGFGVAGGSTGGTGVFGTSLTGAGVVGGSTSNDGIVGSSSASNHSGVWGHNDVAGGVGVAGSSVGGTGVSGTSPNGTGVYGASTNSNGMYGATGSGGASGVYGINNATHTFGAIGLQEPEFGYSVMIGVGVMGDAGDPGPGYTNGNYAIHGITHDPNQTAGYFDGGVVVTTDLQVKGSKNFQIDDPLDPANKYLFHSCVESDVRMTIYHGTITTDATGDATVELPRWFGALNTDVHYQLTVIGQFAQAIVSSKISDNRFSIRTDKPNVEVSWQVTGIRNDAYARAHPMTVEVDKPAHEKGTYTHPELYGLPRRAIDLRTR